MSKTNGTRSPGITTRHGRACNTADGGRCNCRPSYRAEVMRDGQRERQTFTSLKAAKAWRARAAVALEDGVLQASLPRTVADEADEFLAGIRDGSIRSRKGTIYKPASIRSYERALRLVILPAVGSKRLTDLRRADVQRMMDKLIADGVEGSTVRNALDPLRRICDRGVKRDKLLVSPCDRLEVPGTARVRDRVADPAEARVLLAALPVGERALWATALYAGLRLGELRALHAADVDLEADVIHVRRGWDDFEGEQDTKTAAGERVVPIITVLRPFLTAHLMRTGRRETDLMFGRSAALPFVKTTIKARAMKAWGWRRDRDLTWRKGCGRNQFTWGKAHEQALEPIGLHECRHSYASMMVAAGVDPGEVMRRMGHTTIALTFNRYTHGMNGAEQATAAKLDAFIADRAAG